MRVLVYIGGAFIGERTHFAFRIFTKCSLA